MSGPPETPRRGRSLRPEEEAEACSAPEVESGRSVEASAIRGGPAGEAKMSSHSLPLGRSEAVAPREPVLRGAVPDSVPPSPVEESDLADLAPSAKSPPARGLAVPLAEPLPDSRTTLLWFFDSFL